MKNQGDARYEGGRHLRKRNKMLCFGLICALLLIVSASGVLYTTGILPRRTYHASDFGIETVESSCDANQNGVDDYRDILLGARKDANNRPRYKSAYYAGGYPPDSEGVCTDVIWRAFQNAGYLLKDMVDADIASDVDAYPRVAGRPDPNIDFRRVPNLKVFFERNAVSLTLDTHEIAQWQPGDIVVYGTRHIAIISDKRNRKGEPYIIHNAGGPFREEDHLHWGEISGHFRFDASLVDQSLLRYVEGEE